MQVLYYCSWYTNSFTNLSFSFITCLIKLTLMACAATGSSFLMDLPDQRHSANILSKSTGHPDDLFPRQDNSSSSISPFNSSLGADDLPGSADNVFCLDVSVS